MHELEEEEQRLLVRHVRHHVGNSLADALHSFLAAPNRFLSPVPTVYSCYHVCSCYLHALLQDEGAHGECG